MTTFSGLCFLSSEPLLLPSFLFQTQSTLLQMATSKAANKKAPVNPEPAADRLKQPEVSTPDSPVDDSENKKWELATCVTDGNDGVTV